jgi:hypothetical protein
MGVREKASAQVAGYPHEFIRVCLRDRYSDRGELDRGFVNLSLQTVNRPSRAFELSVIMRGECRVALLLPVLDTAFDRSLIDADHFVVFVDVDVQRIAHRHDKVFFIQLGVTLQRFVIDVLGDVAQFREGLMFQFVVCVSHIVLSKK